MIALGWVLLAVPMLGLLAGLAWVGSDFGADWYEGLIWAGIAAAVLGFMGLLALSIRLITGGLT